MNNKKKLQNPVHIKQFQLAYICSLLQDEKYQITIAPKADGINSIIEYKSKLLEAEDMGTYKLVFDSKSYPITHNDTIYARTQWIRSLSPFNFNNKYEASSLDDVHAIIEYDNNMLNNMPNKDIDWFPKTTILIKLSDTNKFIEILETQPNTIYNTDGWIVTVYYKFNNEIKLLFGSPLKVKPIEHMTIDLLYDGKSFVTSNGTKILTEQPLILQQGIWRCNYDSIKKIWVPIGPRSDKYQPNPDHIINPIIKYHENPWKPSDIIKHMDNKSIYYPSFVDNKSLPLGKHTVKFLDYRRKYMGLLLRDIIKTNSDNLIVDIGCGNGSTLDNIHGINYKKYIGIDKDYACLCRCMYKIKQYDSLIWGDITEQNWAYFNDNSIYEEPCDIILCINVIHYVNSKIKMDHFVKNIQKISKIGTKFLLVALDPDIMGSCNLSNMPDDEFTIRNLSNRVITDDIDVPTDSVGGNYYFKYPWLSRDFIEYIPKISLFEDEIKRSGWIEEKNIKEYEWLEKYEINDIFKKYNSFHKIKLFSKII
jgi:SAM-dependent methyltransferase